MEKERIKAYRKWVGKLATEDGFKQWMIQNDFSVEMDEAVLRDYLNNLKTEYEKIQFLSGNKEIKTGDTEIQEIKVSEPKENGTTDKFHNEVTITVRNKVTPKDYTLVIPRGTIGGITKVVNTKNASCTFTCADGSVAKLDLTAKSNAGQSKVKTSVNVGLSLSRTAFSASVTGVSGGLNGLSLQLTGMNLSVDGLFYTAAVWDQSSGFETVGAGGNSTAMNTKEAGGEEGDRG